jgi:peptide/nickel transport system substrate-binding protein
LKISRLAAAATLVAAGALILSGCAAPQSEIVQGTSLSIAQNSGFTSANSSVAVDNSTYNSNISYLMNSTFNYYDSTPKLIKNTKFGTYKVLSKSPLTVKYTIADGVKWSDGTPVDAADMLLQWVSSISKYNQGKVNFGAAAAGGGLDLVTKVPKISDGGKSLTLVYDKPFTDWESAFYSGNTATVPAHVTYDLAFPGKKLSADDAKKAFEKAVDTDDTASLAKIAKVWSTDYKMQNMPSNKNLLLSDGAYVVTNIVKNQYVTLKANKDYTWGPLPHVSKITVRIIPDPLAQVQALQNGEVSIISGQATSDTIKALAQLKGVTTKTSNESTYEHVDLTFNNKGPFDPAAYGGDAAKALAVRKAFLQALPRQDILDKLIKPLNPDATLDDSQVLLPGAPGYDKSIAENGSADYRKVDTDGALATLKAAGIATPVTVKFAYPNDNPRRVSEFQLIQASESKAGFNVVDAGSPGETFFGNLGNGSYDVSVFAWQFTSLAVTGTEPQLKTAPKGSTTSANYNGYSNPTVDSKFAELETTTDASQQQALLQAIDKETWKDAYGATLYQLPDVSANSNKVSNVIDAPLAPTVFWNFWQWELKK